MVKLRSALFSSTVLLAACGGGGGGGSAPAPVPTPPPTPPPTSTSGLFTDAQLLTASDTNSALVNDDAATWFAQNAKTIRSLTVEDDFSDLAFLSDAIAGKQVVMLGESSHGVREFSLAKIRLIKYLHEEQGFNVLAFEGGLFDCESAQRQIEDGMPRDAINNCLFGVWRTQALRELFSYLAATQQTNTPLRITGFDVQASGAAFAQRAVATSALIDKVSPDFARVVQTQEAQFAEWTAAALAATNAGDTAITTLATQLPSLGATYELLADYLLANLSLITADGEFSERDVLIAAQYARTSPDYAQQLRERFSNGQGIAPRDRGMAQNLLALANAIYPDERIIGWAHNAHLRHQGTGFLPGANMGALVHRELADKLYTIGFYMYRGEHAFNDRSVQPVSAPLNFSLEAIFHSRRLAWLFLDLERASISDPGAAWIDEATSTFAWGSREITLRLRDEYDGLFMIDTVTPPQYLD